MGVTTMVRNLMPRDKNICKFILKILLMSIVLTLMFGGCASDMTEPPESIRIFMGAEHGGVPFALFELSENTLQITALGRAIGLFLPHEELFDVSLFYDFIDRIPNIYWILRNSRPIILGSAYDVVRKANRELSQRQLNNVLELVENVVRHRADREFERAPFLSDEAHRYVWAIIDGEMYWSLYSSNINADILSRHSAYVNRNLLLLTYYLIDLSPIMTIFE